MAIQEEIELRKLLVEPTPHRQVPDLWAGWRGRDDRDEGLRRRLGR